MPEWSISRRISFLAGALIASLAVLSIISATSNWLFSQKFGTFRNSSADTEFLTTLREHALEAEGLALRYRFDRDPATAERALAVMAEIAERQDQLRSYVAADPTARTDLAAVDGLLDSYEERFRTIVELNRERNSLLDAVTAARDALTAQITTFIETAGTVSSGDTLVRLAGIERTVLQSGALKEKFLLTNAPEDFEAFLGSAEEARAGMTRLATDPPAPAGLAAAVENLDDYMTSARALADSIFRRNAIQAELDALSADFLLRMDEAAIAERESNEAVAATIEQNIWMSLVIVLGLSALAIAGSAIFATMSARRITGAIARSVNETQELATGNLDVAITGADQTHELGLLARALLVFRDNAVAAKEAQARQAEQERAQRLREEEQVRAQAAAEEASRREAQEARARMVAELRDSLGTVVDGAAAGDFSRRITARFAEEEFNRMAEGVNRLMSNVESGVKEVARVMSQVAAGDLTERMSGNYAGLFGELQASVNETLATLTRVVEDIAAGCEAVTKQASQMTDQSVELARRAEQQAASLEETSAAMEEISATARSSAEGAAQANEFASSATGRVDEAGRVVASAVGAMSDIRAASTRIGEIVSVIEGIAFQTNLLALNASVEAARAGSAGKGFAVVATEVRALAQRSSTASQDIKALIDESAAQVNRGVGLVEETGSTLKEIVEGVRKMAGSLGELVTAGREQAVGVQEVTTAIAQLDVITQKNAALADQSRELAGDLKTRAEAMEGLVATFRTGSGRRSSGKDGRGGAARIEDEWEAA